MIVNENIFQSAAGNLEVKVGANGNITAGAEINTKSGADTKITAGGTAWIDGGPDVQLNGGGSAAEAVKAKFPFRVPQHEPWDGHENWNPSETAPDKTEAVADASKDIHYEDRKVQTDRTPMNEL